MQVLIAQVRTWHTGMQTTIAAARRQADSISVLQTKCVRKRENPEGLGDLSGFPLFMLIKGLTS